MNETVFYIEQHTAKGTEVVYQVFLEEDAADFCDLRNSNLAEMGIPGDVCSWNYTGPHKYNH